MLRYKVQQGFMVDDNFYPTKTNEHDFVSPDQLPLHAATLSDTYPERFDGTSEQGAFTYADGFIIYFYLVACIEHSRDHVAKA